MKNVKFQPMVKQRLSDGIVDQIKQAIYDGHLNPGDRLPSEREMCRVFKVGRPAIREAMRTLDVLGMVEVSHGAKGSVIKEHNIVEYMETVRKEMSWLIRADKKTYKDILNVRNYIDIGIAHAAAENASDEELRELESVLKRLRQSDDEIEDYLPQGIEFHQQLALATKNKIFYLIGEMFRDILSNGYTHLAKEIFPDGPKKLIEGNEVMLQAIKSRDHEAIDQAMKKHNQEESAFMSYFFNQL